MDLWEEFRNMNNLTFPQYRIADTSYYLHLGDMSHKQFENLQKDLAIAYKENREMYFDTLNKINSVREEEVTF